MKNEMWYTKAKKMFRNINALAKEFARQSEV